MPISRNAQRARTGHPRPPGEVGSLLRALREGAGLTQDALARASGCSKAYLSLVESGRRTLSIDKARAIEATLDVHDGCLQAALNWQRVPTVIRAQVEIEQSRSAAMRRGLRDAMRSSNPLAMLRDLVGEGGDIDIDDSRSSVASSTPRLHASTASPGIAPLERLAGRPIPIINKVAAGYPREFTDLDYPASIADDYLSCPDVSDPDAFSARVVGDSMEPEYQEGDVVVFSPLARFDTPHGADCFVRLERDAQTTFKRVYAEDDGRTLRLQPLNSAYPPAIVPREDVAGLYAAVYVLRKIRLGRTSPPGKAGGS